MAMPTAARVATAFNRAEITQTSAKTASDLGQENQYKPVSEAARAVLIPVPLYLKNFFLAKELFPYHWSPHVMFPTTQWTGIARATLQGNKPADAALEFFCQRHVKPFMAFVDERGGECGVGAGRWGRQCFLKVLNTTNHQP